MTFVRKSSIKDATRAVNLQPGDFEASLDEMKRAGVKVIESGDLE